MEDHYVIPLSSILFFDIETVPATAEFSALPEKMQLLWDKKSTHFRKEEETAADVYQRAGIYAEFGKIVCISVGHINMKNGEKQLRLKSYYGDDEKALLEQFSGMLEKFTRSGEKFLCGHNSDEFDVPYVARRMLVNQVPLPDLLNNAGKKPWEVRHLDTMKLWKFGDYKHFTSLDLLTSIFDIPTPKDDIDGSEVAGVYYDEKDVKRIARYCEKDVQAVVQLFLRYRYEPLIKQEHVSYSVE